MNLEVIIGLEIHAQLNTKSKLWCSCDNDAFGVKANTRVCPVCMGFPGALPVLNEKALQKALRAGIAFNCQINQFSKFDRKNYFYPDLPTGYQITQNELPFSENGKITILVPKEIDEHGNYKKISAKKIKITRIHLENDAGKLKHSEQGSFIDFNRAGSPLIEIVTEPDLRSAIEAKCLAQEVQKILRTIQASEADMEKGMMRFDASVSLRPEGDKKLYPRAEIKNLNSFNALQKAIEFEISRQSALWQAGNPPMQDSTRGWKDELGETKLMRLKESADDYRYFPEPDLPPLELTNEQLAEISREIPELPADKYLRYTKEYKLTSDEALLISSDWVKADFFERVVSLTSDAQNSAKLFISSILTNENWENSEIKPEHLAEVLELLNKDKISASSAKKILDNLMQKGGKAETLMVDLGLEQVSNTAQIEDWISEVLNNNPQTVEDFKNGKTKVLGFLVGQVMKISRGSANPALVQKMIKEKLS